MSAPAQYLGVLSVGTQLITSNTAAGKILPFMTPTTPSKTVQVAWYELCGSVIVVQSQISDKISDARRKTEPN